MPAWLSNAELAEAIALGRAAASRQARRMPPRQGRVGERLANTMGAGSDYADSRPMAAGDNPRHINWRATARLGGQAANPLVRLYHPELSSQWVMVLDGRAPMIFGSRSRLKWAQALRAALFYTALRAESGDEVALLTLREGGVTWQPAMPARKVLARLGALAGEARSLPDASSGAPVVAPSLWPQLQQPMRAMARGSQWLVLGEPCGLYQGLESFMPMVGKLASRFDVRVVELTDPLDEHLPAAGDLKLHSDDGVSLWRSGSSRVRADFQRRQRKALAEGRDKLAASGMLCRTLNTADHDPDEALLA